MGNRKDIVYDPREAQREDIDKLLRSEELSLEALSNSPPSIQLLLKQQYIQLIELQELKSKLSESEKIKEQLRDEREELRIEIATLRERDTVSLMEIPISIASGFAINILTTNIQNGVGWFLFVISLILLAFIRRGQLDKLIQRLNPQKEIS